MGIPRMFKLGKPKQFQFSPRFFNERKEALDNRIKQVQSEMEIAQESPEYRPSFTHGTLKNRMTTRKKTERSSTLRLLLIVTILLFLAAYLIYK